MPRPGARWLPFARSATGDLATEDLVFLLNGLGVATGVDLAALARTSLWLARRLAGPAPAGGQSPRREPEP